MYVDNVNILGLSAASVGSALNKVAEALHAMVAVPLPPNVVAELQVSKGLIFLAVVDLAADLSDAVFLIRCVAGRLGSAPHEGAA